MKSNVAVAVPILPNNFRSPESNVLGLIVKVGDTTCVPFQVFNLPREESESVRRNFVLAKDQQRYGTQA